MPVEPNPSVRKGILFTAFEPSGDDHACAVVAELRRRHPTLPIYAWAGPKTEAAGATIIERTGDAAVMGVPGLSKILEHRRINCRVARWLDSAPVRGTIALHVPVDSPAANFPICKITRERGIKIVHLVAPQMWAWGPWRVAKLRRLTDKVLCLLPFEEDWFMARAVPAKFIGHPLFDTPLNLAELDARVAATIGAGEGASGTGFPKLALMPGSRPSEIASCFPILLDAFNRLKKDFPGASGVIAATKPAVADAMRRRAGELGGWPDDLAMVAGDTDAVIRWCDFALVVSGTVTLQIAKQARPMVAVYRPKRLMYNLIMRWLISTELFTLPNLIAGKRIVTEFIPHFGDGEDLTVEVIRLMRQPAYADDQRRELEKVVARFNGYNAANSAADEIEKMLG
ncbi:MAG: hypothetical protein H7210_14890 [Pyrinomonadaceae bacterium]|nr:hypothetical protein [Phycisphaerales bacterium]